MTPIFKIKETPRGKLVVCTIGDQQGAARVDSAGLKDAMQRAQAQAEAKVRDGDA